MTWEGKEKEGYLAPLDIRGLLELREPLEFPEVLATQVSVSFITLKARSMTLSIALPSWNQLCKQEAV